MSTPHKATPSDWAWLEGNSTVDRCDAAWSRGLIELRARVEALEAGATCPHVRTSDEGTSYCALAEQHQDKLDRLIAQDRAASADARPTVKARITRDRDETGDYLIIHDASPPASSLVERVAIALAESDHPHQLWHDDARAAIREVATWLRDRGGYPWAWVAQTLEQEADQ